MNGFLITYCVLALLFAFLLGGEIAAWRRVGWAVFDTVFLAFNIGIAIWQYGGAA